MSVGTKPSRQKIAAKMCPSFGSLKTEEKTECQCGQVFRATILRGAREMNLSVNSAIDIPVGGNK